MIRRPWTDRPAALVAVAVQCLVGACGGESDAAALPTAIRSDSAGVEIVVVPTRAEDVPVLARLAGEPELRIGSIAGGPEEQFGSIEDLVPLGDGGVAVLDAQAGEIRLFDEAGTHVGTLGSKGLGPGELTSPSELVLLLGDTLAVYDGATRRITRFGPDGALGRVTALEETGSRVSVASFMPDGALVGMSRRGAAGGPPPGSEPTFVRDVAVLTLFGPDGAVGDTLDVLPGEEAIVSIEVGERSVSVFKRSALLGRTHVFAAGRAGVWSGVNDSFEIRMLEAPGGRLVRIVRAPGLEEPATEELARSLLDEALADASTPEARRTIERWHALSPRAGTLPAYDRVVVDDRARIWMQSWRAPDAPARWWVFTDTGDLLGRVEVPSRTTILSVRCGRLWGVEHDELDVGYVVRYALPDEGCGAA